jgi:hypothetical protein
VPEDLEMTREEKWLAELHGLDAEQIYWRLCKIADEATSTISSRSIR